MLMYIQFVVLNDMYAQVCEFIICNFNHTLVYIISRYAYMYTV